MIFSPHLTGLALACALPLLKGPSDRIERQLEAMGTWLTIEVDGSDRSEALQRSEAAFAAIRAVEERLSTWTPDSELARLNAAPVDARFPLSAELASDLETCRDLVERTHGAFDPGVGALVDAWDLRGAGRLPTDVERARALAACGMASLQLEAGDAPFAVRTVAGLRLEEGGFGKGVGLDAALAALRQSGATHATLDLGGQLAVLGTEAGERFAVAHPDRRTEAVLEIEVDSGSLATSGNSERAITVDGVRYAHLLDPRTGHPAHDFGSVTVWSESATSADALSTALFVLGPAEGFALAEQLAGIEAVFLARSSAGLCAYVTAGLRARVHPSRDPNGSFELSILSEPPSPESEPSARQDG